MAISKMDDVNTEEQELGDESQKGITDTDNAAVDTWKKGLCNMMGI